MKKYFCLVLIVTVCFVFRAAALTAATNLAAGKQISGTFFNGQAATDGQVTRITTAASGNVAHAPQFLTIDLGRPQYIKSIKIVWDKDAYSHAYDVRVSNNTKSWHAEALAVDAGSGVVDNYAGIISQTITGKRFTSASRYLQIYLPLKSKVNNLWNNNAKIVEVQVFPAVGQKIAIEATDAYVVTSNKAIVTVKTNIGAEKAEIFYGNAPGALNQTATIYEVGQLTSATLNDLTPRRTVFYKARVWDYFGNAAESQVLNFVPRRSNIALKKRVTGTFNQLPPRDPYVEARKDVLARVTDGSTSYFTSMATSGQISRADQYAVIDLGGPYSLRNIVTYWRNLAYPEEFSIQVSNDNRSYSTVAAKLNAGNGAFSRSDTGDPMRVLGTNVSGVTARYVKILIERGSACFQKHADWDFVQLMEVEVIPR